MGAGSPSCVFHLDFKAPVPAASQPQRQGVGALSGWWGSATVSGSVMRLLLPKPRSPGLGLPHNALGVRRVKFSRGSERRFWTPPLGKFLPSLPPLSPARQGSELEAQDLILLEQEGAIEILHVQPERVSNLPEVTQQVKVSARTGSQAPPT